MIKVNWNLQLDAIKKLELSFLALVVLVAGYFIYQNWGFWSGNEIDRNISSWIEERRVGVDPTKAVGINNPEDPAKHAVVTVFACHDGKLELVATGGESDKRMGIVFEPDNRRRKYNSWRDQAAQLASIKDPVRRMLMMAGINLADKRAAGTVALAGLTAEQKKEEMAAREELRSQLLFIDSGAWDGTFEPQLYAKVIKALEGYQGNDQELSKSPAKTRLANSVMELGLQYVTRVQEARVAAVTKYVDTVDKLLEPSQRQKLQEVASRVGSGGRGHGLKTAG